MRAFTLLVMALISSGCASTWDTLTSRKFRQDPFSIVKPSEDALTVMRTSQEGDERAHAMKRLKEPVRHGGTSQEQDEAIRLLTTAACTDPSPVVRLAAIDAVSRFQDDRCLGILTAAFHAGDGVPAGTAKPKPRKPLNPDDPMMLAERFSLRGPVGFPEEVASAIRSRAIMGLANTGKPEALAVLAQAAQGGGETPVDRDTQLAAVRGLSRVRTPEAVGVLVGVLKAEKGKDPAMTHRAQDSLASLTGKNYADDPQAWETALAAGTATIVPEPSGLMQVGAIFTR